MLLLNLLICTTLTGLAGIKPPDNLDGQSFRHVLDDPYGVGRDAVLSQFNRPWESAAPEVMGYSIRTSSKRYTDGLTGKLEKYSQKSFMITRPKQVQENFQEIGLSTKISHRPNQKNFKP